MGMEVFSRAYVETPVGKETWVVPDKGQTLEDFQSVVAAAEAWEFVAHIEILEIREDRFTGRRMVDGLRFRRLK